MNKKLAYSAKYDSYYDPENGEWIEPSCGDPTCEFCANRPAKAFTPSPVNDSYEQNDLTAKCCDMEEA